MAKLEPGSGKYPVDLSNRTGVRDERYWPLVQNEDNHYDRGNEFENIQSQLSNFSQTLEQLQEQVERMQRYIIAIERRKETKPSYLKPVSKGGKISRRRK